MTENPATVSPGASADMVRQQLESGGLHHLPVVDAGRVVGIVSSADLMKLYLLSGAAALRAATVAQIMVKDPVVIEAGSTMRQAAEMLAAGGFHALPVVDSGILLVGIITSSDLITALLRNIPVGDGSIVQRPADSLAAVIEKNRRLEDVVDAAKRYINGGQAEREHSVLVRALAALEGAERKLSL
ncbi:MAG: CBS domain-containing protein [Gammaproteobacteria bacterium]|nr:CBS domain-containing protein [Gammaproteobacteria bacterium]